ncbi:MAG TPA: MFS transporter [Patescibacteria group bacterium]|nr:MFS transporter [Patescibacteria group bacterium]
MTAGRDVPAPASGPSGGALEVFGNRPFLLLWLAQAATQIGGNMVIFGLTVIIAKSTGSTTAVSALILTFLLPAVLFSALAGVFVDRLDRRIVLILTNILRGVAFIAMFFAGDHLGAIYLLNIAVSTITVFFAPAEAAMIPMLIPRKQLMAANGIFTLTLNAAFALGFTLIGPLIVKIAGAPALIVVVAILYFVAAGFCFTLPPAPPVVKADAPTGARGRVREAENALGTVVSQLREGLGYIHAHREIRWSLIYLGIAASLVGVLGVLGPSFAEKTLGLSSEDFVVVVLPLGVGIVMGILLLNAYGRLLPRRRVIEGGLIALGGFLLAMALSGRISSFLGSSVTRTGLPDMSLLTSLLSVVVAVAFFAGVAYAAVAIPAQTQLQEDLPEDVRGRVFGVLNMLVSVASFLPILIVGPIADIIGTTLVMVIVAILIGASGIASIYLRGPLRATERERRANVSADHDPFVNALGVELRAEDYPDEDGDGVPDWPEGSRPATVAEMAEIASAADPAPELIGATGPDHAAEILPAADPLTAAAAPLDPDAVTRQFPLDPPTHEAGAAGPRLPAEADEDPDEDADALPDRTPPA